MSYYRQNGFQGKNWKTTADQQRLLIKETLHVDMTMGNDPKVTIYFPEVFQISVKKFFMRNLNLNSCILSYKILFRAKLRTYILYAHDGFLSVSISRDSTVFSLRVPCPGLGVSGTLHLFLFFFIY